MVNTLATLNEAIGQTAKVDRVWMGWTLRTSYAVGRCGRQTSHRGQTGAKAHLLRVETLIAKDGPDDRPGLLQVGGVFSVKGCNGNGQMTGVIVKGADLADITCAKCLKRLAAIRDTTEADFVSLSEYQMAPSL